MAARLTLDEAAEQMARDFMGCREASLKRIRGLVEELRASQTDLLRVVAQENAEYDLLSTEQLATLNRTFAKMPQYQGKVLMLAKRMKDIGIRVSRLKARAKELSEAQPATGGGSR